MSAIDAALQLLTFAIGSGVLGLVAKSLFHQLLLRDLERAKAALRQDVERSVEEWKADLKKLQFEHETRYSRLHASRAEAVLEIYSNLVEAEGAVSNMLALGSSAVDGPAEERKNVAWKRHGDLMWSIFRRRPLFSEEDCGLLEKARASIQGAFHRGQTPDIDRVDLYRVFKTEFVPLREEVERRVRALLGRSEDYGNHIGKPDAPAVEAER